jgi:hypothetical protein
LIHYKNGNKKNVVRRQTFNGVYKGNKAAATDTTQIDYDCKTNQPIHPDSQPDVPSDRPADAASPPDSTSSSNAREESGVANEYGTPSEESEWDAEPTEDEDADEEDAYEEGADEDDAYDSDE